MQPSITPVRSSGRIWRNLALLLTSVTGTLLLLEVTLRVLGMQDPVTYRTDAVLGYEPRPNQSAKRLGVPIYINDLGLRDDEDGSTLLRSSTRILVIGNSVTYGGSRTHQRDLFTEVLERELRERGRDLKVLNGGVNGYSVSQMMARARTLTASSQPTSLVLFLLRGDFQRAPVVFIREGNFVYPLHRPTSALLDFLRLAVNHLNSRYGFLQYLPAGVKRSIEPDPVHVPPYDGARILDIHFAAIQNFLRSVWEPAGRSPDDITAFFSPTRAELIDGSGNANRDLIQRFAALGIRAYDLRSAYRDSITKSGRPVEDLYFDDVHYLPAGHALAGRTLAAYLLPTSQLSR